MKKIITGVILAITLLFTSCSGVLTIGGGNSNKLNFYLINDTNGTIEDWGVISWDNWEAAGYKINPDTWYHNNTSNKFKIYSGNTSSAIKAPRNTDIFPVFQDLYDHYWRVPVSDKGVPTINTSNDIEFSISTHKYYKRNALGEDIEEEKLVMIDSDGNVYDLMPVEVIGE